jgi:hypothetical protein
MLELRRYEETDAGSHAHHGKSQLRERIDYYCDQKLMLRFKRPAEPSSAMR